MGHYFGDRFTNNNKFEQLLRKPLIAQRISLVQVSQLLLLRNKEYDKIGVYYDASASAYQIMGTLHFDKQLCQLTNVIQDQATHIKGDLYVFFRKGLSKELNKNNFEFMLDENNITGKLVQQRL